MSVTPTCYRDASSGLDAQHVLARRLVKGILLGRAQHPCLVLRVPIKWIYHALWQEDNVGTCHIPGQVLHDAILEGDGPGYLFRRGEIVP